MTPWAGVDGPVVLAAACAAAAAWSWTGPSGPATRLDGLGGRAAVGPPDPVGPVPAAGSPRAPGRAARVPAVLVALGAAVGTVAGTAGPVAAVAAAVLLAAVLRHRRAARERAEGDEVLAESAALCEALAAELRAGQPPARALRAAAGDGDGPGATALRRAAGVAELGGDVASALGLEAGPSEPVLLPPAPGRPSARARGRAPETPRQDGRVDRSPAPGALVRLAACWRVAETSGAALAPVVDRLASGLRAQERQRAELAGELTGARTTGRLLAALPVLGVALAAAVGARPVEFLLGTPLGGACLLGALALDLAGLAWTGRLAARALTGTG